MEHSHVRIPPDSTGKRMLHSMYMIITYQYAIDSTPGFGEVLIGSASNAESTVVHIDPANTLTAGFVGVMSEKFSDKVYSIGESLVSNGNHVGVVTQCVPFYQPYMHLAGGNDTVNLVQIDNKGSMYTRFAEGEPQMDAFANLKISDTTLLGEYAFPHSTTNYRWQIEEVNGGNVTYDHDIYGMVLQNNTAVNALSRMTTHQYHHYTPGLSQTIQCTVACGDTGKENVIRRWGYFDDNDGVFFELNQNTMYACLRSSLSGTPVDTKIPRSEWNRDRLTGLGGHYNYSRHLIDPSKNTIYEIDFQWLGAGSVRFFVNVNGTRVPCHEIHNSGKHPVPYMRTGSLPFRVEQLNLAASASTSEMRFYTAAVVTDGVYTPFHGQYGLEPTFARTISGTTPVVHASLRPAQFIISDGENEENRGYAVLRDVMMFSSAEPIQVSMHMNAELTDANWAKASACPDSFLEVDRDATAITGGRLLETRMIPAGTPTVIDCTKIFSTIGEFALRRKALIEGYFSVSMTVRSLTGNATDIMASMNWEEVF